MGGQFVPWSEIREGFRYVGGWAQTIGLVPCFLAVGGLRSATTW